MMQRFLTCLAVPLASYGGNAAAVVIRHDVPAAQYEAKALQLPGYCRLELPDGGGALIHASWVLTAAHLAGDLKPGKSFHCGNEVETIDRVVVNPAFREDVGRDDLALVHLAASSHLQPVPLLPEAPKVGTSADLIGDYQGGTGLTGGVGRTPAGLRGATNRISAADDDWLRFVFDAPSSPETTMLEGVSGAGDSGAPAYQLHAGKWFVVGIGSRSKDTNHNGIEQDYGDTDLYVPVASHMAWISQTIGVARPSDVTGRSRPAVEQAVFDRLKNEGFSGSVSVLQHGKLLLQRAAGRANSASVFRVDTKADIASIAKPITALAIFKLAERGKLHVDDPLARWFPRAPADKRAITLRQMLNHSSGLVDIPPGMSDYRPTSASDMQKRIFAEPLDFAPGSKNSYSNSGYNLLGMIVEKASGSSLFRFLEAEVFQPAGVQASYDPEAFPFRHVASGMPASLTDTSVRDRAAARRGPFWGLWGAGGVFMSAPDLTKLFKAFQQGKIVSPASAYRMTHEVVPAGSYASEGLGWTLIHTARGEDFISYTGASDHSNSAIRYYPREDVLIAAVANSSSPGAIRMARELVEPLIGPDFEPNVPPRGTPPLSAAPAADVKAIQNFMRAVAGSSTARLEYVRATFSAAYRKKVGDEALADKLSDLKSVGMPKIISIFRRDENAVLMFETQESEYPRLYELVLERATSNGALDGYHIKRLTA